MRNLVLILSLAVTVPLVAQRGSVKEHYPDGRVKSSRFEKDGREYVFAYHTNGRLASSSEYVGGVRDGLWKQYDERGQLVVKACFDLGRRCGTWEFFSGSGSLRGRLSFEEGVLAEGQAYGTAGELIAAREY